MIRLAFVNPRIARLPAALLGAIILPAGLAWAPIDAQEAPGAGSNDELIASAPLADRGDAGPTRFRLISPSHTGVDFTIDWTPPEGVSMQGINSTGSCGGVCMGDYDGDGRPDLFVTRPFGGNRLYRNLGNFKFENVTRRVGMNQELAYDAWGAGPCFVDLERRRTSRPLCLQPSAAKPTLHQPGKWNLFRAGRRIWPQLFRRVASQWHSQTTTGTAIWTRPSSPIGWCRRATPH